MDEAILAQLVDEIAALLCKYLPDTEGVQLQSGQVGMGSKSCAQRFAFRPGYGGVFSVSAELRHSRRSPVT